MKEYLTEKGIARFQKPGLELLDWFHAFWERNNSKEEAEVLTDLTALNATELCLVDRVTATKSMTDLPLSVEEQIIAASIWKTDTALMVPCHTARRIAHGRPADIRVWDGFFFTGDAQKATQVFLDGPGDLRFADLQDPKSFTLYANRLKDALKVDGMTRLSEMIPPFAREIANLLAYLRILVAYRSKAKARAIEWPVPARR